MIIAFILRFELRQPQNNVLYRPVFRIHQTTRSGGR